MHPTLWFAGTPSFAAHSLAALISAPQYQITAVLTQPDRPAGRGKKLTASPVKQLAQSHNIPIAQPERLDESTPPHPNLARPDLIIVAAYGLLLPPWFLNYPRLGCINIHASLLPRWRGAAPIQRAIEAGDTETGIGIMQMATGLDTGDIWLEKRLSIDPRENSQSLHERLMHLGAEALLEALPLILTQSTQPTPQATHGITYAHKLNKAEGQLNWQHSTRQLDRQIRAFSGYPVAHTQLDGQILRIHQAQPLTTDTAPNQPPGTVLAHTTQGLDVATGDGTLRISELQLAGKAKVTAQALRNGTNLTGKQLQ